MAQFTVLFVDNDQDFLNTRTEFLENAGYRVIKAASLDQARKFLSDALVHLAILDIRIVDDDDEKDISGLVLAKEPAYSLIPKIILTNFPSYQDVREVLKPALQGLPPAVDFLSKKDGPTIMIQAVHEAFDKYVRLNQDLRIDWGPRESLNPLHLARLLNPDASNEVLVQRADELEDLLRRVFCDYQQVRIGRLLWHIEQRLCVPVLAQSTQQATDARILVCGERGPMEQELACMQELVPERGATLVNTTDTVHFCAAIYALADAQLESIQTLRELFQSGKKRPLTTALDRLLKDTLADWHQRGQALQESGHLIEVYRRWAELDQDGTSRSKVKRHVEKLVQISRALSAVEIQSLDQGITFQFPQQAPLNYPDPVAILYTPLESYSGPIVCRVSPGRLTPDNVLIDAQQRTWLTDLARAGQAPQWWDFVCLEALFRFDLSQAPDLLAWQEFEECLICPNVLHDNLREQDVVQDLRMSVTLIEQIRRQAGSEAGPDPRPYYAGLLAWVVGAIAQHDPSRLYTPAEQMRNAHLLMAAAMLANRLSESTAKVNPGGSLRLDAEGTVWMGERRVDELGGQELDLLRLLYEQPGQLVKRERIIESVFGEPYAEGDKHQAGRINSLIRRLRVKIEPNSRRPRYLLTVKGKGYRLQVKNKPQE
jgi:DNA-binding response OmpR family regulator